MTHRVPNIDGGHMVTYLVCISGNTGHGGAKITRITGAIVEKRYYPAPNNKRYAPVA